MLIVVVSIVAAALLAVTIVIIIRFSRTRRFTQCEYEYTYIYLLHFTTRIGSSLVNTSDVTLVEYLRSVTVINSLDERNYKLKNKFMGKLLAIVTMVINQQYQ